MNEKIALLTEAYACAQKGKVCESSLCPSSSEPEDMRKDIEELMATFHTLDAFVIGTKLEDYFFNCGPANHWTVQVGYSESTPNIWRGWEPYGESDAYAVITYNLKGVRKICVFSICRPIAEIYARLFLNPTEASIYGSRFNNSAGVITEK